MVIITGVHRSGTTYLGKILESSGFFHTIHEPFNKDYGIKGVEYWYPFYDLQNSTTCKEIPDLLDKLYNKKLNFKIPRGDNKSAANKITRKIFKSRGNIDYWTYKLKFTKREIVYKDPFLSLCSNYFLDTYDDVKVIYVVRHPIAVFESVKRMKWDFNSKEFLSQMGLSNPFLTNILNQDENLAYRIANLWNIVNQRVYEDSFTYGNAIFIRQEDLSLKPLDELGRIFSFLNYPLNDKVLNFVKSTTKGQIVNPNHEKQHVFSRDSAKLAYSWKKDWKEEYDQILELTRPLLKQFNY